jgi:hypothetical protein
MYFLLYKLYIMVNFKNKTLVWIAEIQYQMGQEVLNFCQQIQVDPRAQLTPIEWQQRKEVTIVMMVVHLLQVPSLRICEQYPHICGPDSSVGIVTELRAGRSGDRIPVG